MENGAEGIGYIELNSYMGRDQMPTEDEQFEAYKSARNNERQTSCSSYLRYWWR